MKITWGVVAAAVALLAGPPLAARLLVQDQGESLAMAVTMVIVTDLVYVVVAFYESSPKPGHRKLSGWRASVLSYILWGGVGAAGLYLLSLKTYWLLLFAGGGVVVGYFVRRLSAGWRSLIMLATFAAHGWLLYRIFWV